MVDPIGAAEAIEVRSRGSSTDIRLPTSLLWLLVFGGIGMLTANARLVWEQLEAHNKRIENTEKVLNAHADQPDHERSARVLLLLDERLRQLEAEEAEALKGHVGEGAE